MSREADGEKPKLDQEPRATLCRHRWTSSSTLVQTQGNPEEPVELPDAAESCWDAVQVDPHRPLVAGCVYCSWIQFPVDSSLSEDQIDSLTKLIYGRYCSTSSFTQTDQNRTVRLRLPLLLLHPVCCAARSIWKASRRRALLDHVSGMSAALIKPAWLQQAGLTSPELSLLLISCITCY